MKKQRRSAWIVTDIALGHSKLMKLYFIAQRCQRVKGICVMTIGASRHGKTWQDKHDCKCSHHLASLYYLLVRACCVSLITNSNNFQLNIIMTFSYSSSFDPVSSPSNHLLKKIIFLHHFLFRIRPFCKKMDHFGVSFVIWKLSRSRELTKPTLLDFSGSGPLPRSPLGNDL